MPRFPGAIESRLVTTMDFVTPSDFPIIPKYRVMNADGVMEDKTRARPDVTNEQVLTWYRNMLVGKAIRPRSN
jgi:2-oxoisovalerate dehydrogenase E1 component alpha subunit